MYVYVRVHVLQSRAHKKTAHEYVRTYDVGTYVCVYVCLPEIQEKEEIGGVRMYGETWRFALPITPVSLPIHSYIFLLFSPYSISRVMHILPLISSSPVSFFFFRSIVTIFLLPCYYSPFQASLHFFSSFSLPSFRPLTPITDFFPFITFPSIFFL